MVHKNIVLASSSKARNTLMKSLNIPYQAISPHIDETPYPHESVPETVKRLAELKANHFKDRFQNTLIIGCDQLGVIDNYVLSKPSDHSDAVKQLRLQSGNEIIFYTAISIYDTATNEIISAIERYHVYFRKITQDEIEDYLQKEKPYECAGSLRVDGLGITLIERLEGDDYSALIGLPLIRLSEMLRNKGVNLYK